MSETWYVAWHTFNTIEPVEIDRSTARYVWIGTARHARESYQSYFPTWEQAHSYLLKKAENDLVTARRGLEHAQGRLGNVKGMRRPTEAVSSAT